MTQEEADVQTAAALRRAAEHWPAYKSHHDPNDFIKGHIECSCGGAVADGTTLYAKIWKEHIESLIPEGRHLETVIAAALENATCNPAFCRDEMIWRKVLELREAQVALTEAEWWVNNWYGEHSKYKECECLACNRDRKSVV